MFLIPYLLTEGRLIDKYPFYLSLLIEKLRAFILFFVSNLILENFLLL